MNYNDKSEIGDAVKIVIDNLIENYSMKEVISCVFGQNNYQSENEIANIIYYLVGKVGKFKIIKYLLEEKANNLNISNDSSNNIKIINGHIVSKSDNIFNSSTSDLNTRFIINNNSTTNNESDVNNYNQVSKTNLNTSLLSKQHITNDDSNDNNEDNLFFRINNHKSDEKEKKEESEQPEDVDIIDSSNKKSNDNNSNENENEGNINCNNQNNNNNNNNLNNNNNSDEKEELNKDSVINIYDDSISISVNDDELNPNLNNNNNVNSENKGKSEEEENYYQIEVEDKNEIKNKKRKLTKKNRNVGFHYSYSKQNFYKYYPKKISKNKVDFYCCDRKCKGKGIYEIQSKIFTITHQHSLKNEHNYCKKMDIEDVKYYEKMRREKIENLQLIF